MKNDYISTSLKYVTGCGPIISEYCQKEGMSIDDISDLVNKDRTSINKWLEDRLGISPNDLNKLVDCFGPEFKTKVQERVRFLENRKNNVTITEQRKIFSDSLKSSHRPAMVKIQDVKSGEQDNQTADSRKLEPSKEEPLPASEIVEVKSETETKPEEKDNTEIKKKDRPVWDFAIKFISWIESDRNATSGLSISGCLMKGQQYCQELYDKNVARSPYELGEIVRIGSERFGLVVQDADTEVRCLIGKKIETLSKENVRHTGRRYDAE